MKLAKLLIKTRKKYSLTQSEMAYKLNISIPIYKFLEYGDPLWDTKALIKQVKSIDNELKIH
jgi:DNA-binding XRE family transcriptional regulator